MCPGAGLSTVRDGLVHHVEKMVDAFVEKPLPATARHA